MGFFIAGDFNPNPETNTEDRHWVALDQSGFILPSHGLAVPTDTPNQPARPTGIAGAPGNFAVPRFGWPAAYFNVFSDTTVLTGYIEDVAVDVQVVEWKPDDLSGVVLDSYGALWPFGSKMPIAPTASTGAPFGLCPLPFDYGGVTTTCINRVQMHSGNGLPFGLGGHATGFGHMLSMDGVVLTWGGPVPALSSPAVDLGINVSGIPGASGANCVRDFKLNPNNSGQFYVLFDSGYVYSGGKLGSAAVNVAAGTPQADGGSGITPGANVALTRNGWRWMHVEWGQYIVIVHTSGDTWGLRLTGGTEPIPPTLSPPAAHPAWWVSGIPAPYHPGWYQDGAIIPHAAPAHFWQIALTGEVKDDVLAGALSISGLTTGSTETITTKPTVSWTYNETFGVPQKNYSIRIYPVSYITAQGAAFVPGQNAGAEEVHDAIAGTTTASHRCARNLRNGIAYRAYLRVRSAADAETAWTTLTFTMAIPLPTQPSSCVATPVTGTWPTSLGTINITAGGGSPPSGEYLQFQVSALNGPFVDVWQASMSTVATVNDPFPPTNVTLIYRVRRIKRVPGLVASAWRTASGVTLLPPSGAPGGFRFVDVGPAGAGPIVILELEVGDKAYVAAASFEGQEPRGEFQALTQSAKTVTSGGRKGDDHTITLKALDTAQYHALYKMLSLSRPILYMNSFGRRWWVAATPGTWKTLVLGPLPAENTGIRDAHDVTLKLVNTNPPR